MIQQYIEYFYPGSFVSETSTAPVARREAPSTLPPGIYGYRFFARREIDSDGEKLAGKPFDTSPITYIGAVLTVADVEALPGDYPRRVLLSNMRCNGWDRVVRTVRGNFQPLNEGDTVLAPTIAASPAPDRSAP